MMRKILTLKSQKVSGFGGVHGAVIELQTAAAVILLQALGVIDIGVSYMGDNEVLAHALTNASSVTLAGGYAIKRSNTFVNEYGRTDKEGNTTDGRDSDPHHLMAAFPTLWCYGKGGMETKWPIPIPYDVHVHAATVYWHRFSQRVTFHTYRTSPPVFL